MLRIPANISNNELFLRIHTQTKRIIEQADRITKNNVGFNTNLFSQIFVLQVNMCSLFLDVFLRNSTDWIYSVQSRDWDSETQRNFLQF